MRDVSGAAEQLSSMSCRLLSVHIHTANPGVFSDAAASHGLEVSRVEIRVFGLSGKIIHIRH